MGAEVRGGGLVRLHAAVPGLLHLQDSSGQPLLGEIEGLHKV